MYLLFDIGGTKMRFALSSDQQTFHEIQIIDTPSNFSEAIKRIRETVLKVAEGKQIEMIVGGVAGILNGDRSILLKSPNLPLWNDIPLKHEFEQLFHAPTLIENDSALVGLGEALHGAGVGKNIVAYMTVSTGVGGVRIINGKIDQSTYGFEPGHQIIWFDDRAEHFEETTRDLESYISGRSLERMFDQKAETINNPAIWTKVARLLAIGIHNTILHWSPEVVVLGGAMMKSIDIEAVQFYLNKNLKVFSHLPEIKKATIEDIGGLYGSLEYLKQHFPPTSG